MVVISGRELDDLRRKVDVDGLTYAACHGLHVMHADGQTYRHTISQGKSKKDQGGFQLLDLIITELKSHMTC